MFASVNAFGQGKADKNGLAPVILNIVAGKCPIEISSQRGGEKLHESLVTKEESRRMASYRNYSVINPEVTTWPYTAWSSEFVDWSEDSSKAEQYTDKELETLLGI